MKRILKILFLIALAVVVIGASLFGYFYLRWVGVTSSDTARILVHDDKFGARAIDKAILHGDSILPIIQWESNNFQLLNNRNSFWIAEVLGSIKTPRSKAIMMDLYSRTDLTARLVASIGLAKQGIFPDAINEQSFLVKVVQKDGFNDNYQLAIIALGWTKNRNALPCLLDLLRKRNIDYWDHAYACEAVSRIHSSEAIPVLRDCLRSEGFYALPQAFSALVSLGDRDAVPLAIARIGPDLRGYNSGDVVNELERVTGESFGYEQSKWNEWWKSAKSSWQLPSKYIVPLDE
jgi:hypothetical protein